MTLGIRFLGFLKISPQNLPSALPLGYPGDEGDGEVVRHVRRAHAKLHQPNNQTDSGKVHHANPQKHTQEYKNYLNILHENMMLLEDHKQ